jgi:hypothetical protein
MTEADAQSQENEVDAALKRAMPEGFDAIMRLRAVKAGQPGIAAAPQPEPEPPDLSVALIGPESLKPKGPAETMLANAAVLAHAAMVLSYQRGLAAHGALGDAYLTQGARQALAVAGLLDGLQRTQSKPASKRLSPPVRSSRESYNAYQRDLMRRRKALAKVEPSRLDA